MITKKTAIGDMRDKHDITDHRLERPNTWDTAHERFLVDRLNNSITERHKKALWRSYERIVPERARSDIPDGKKLYYHALDFRDECFRVRRGARAINMDLRNIQTFSNYCAEILWLFDKIEIHKALRLKHVSEPGRHYTPEHFQALVPVARFRDETILQSRGHSDYPWSRLLKFLYQSGFRIGEALDLQWSHISEGLIFSPGAKSTDRRANAIPLTSELQAVIFYGCNCRSKAKVFPWKSSSIGLLRTWLIQDAARAGIPYYGLHAFRRSLVVRLLDAGHSADTVQKLARHKDIQTTMRHYSNWQVGQRADILASVSK